MNKQQKSLITLVVIFIIGTVFQIKTVYAVSIEWNVDGDSNGGSTNNPNPPGTESVFDLPAVRAEPDNGTIRGSVENVKGLNMNCTSYCTYDHGVSGHNGKLEYELYDLYNKKIDIDAFSSIDTFIPAGTMFGISLYEERSATWYGSGARVYECVGKRLVEDCATYCPNDGGECSTHCDYYVETFYESYSSADSGCDYNAKYNGYLDALRVISGGPSYELEIYDPNEASCHGKKNGEDGCKTYKTGFVGGKVPPFDINNPTIIQNYYYETNGACINIRNSQVRYLTNENEKCGKDEFFIANDNESEETRHWHVFTPLNTKKTQNYNFVLATNYEKKQRPDICKSIMENYPNKYKDHIKLKDYNLTGNPKTDIEKMKKEGGCYFETVVNLPIVQEFYNEIVDPKNKDESTLIGFNFYYRPIDINNPFPNGIDNNSYWKYWNEEKTSNKKLDISKSFDTVTYNTTDINIKEIRKINDKELYTDWSEMNINGSSNFIEKGYVKRSNTINNNSFYSIGCGKLNQCEYYIDNNGEKKKNPIYQSKCKVKKEGDVCP